MRRLYESIQIFKNPHLEKLTHVHPLTPLVIWVPVSGWLIWRGFALHRLNPVGIAIIGISALFVWTLVEYLLHRFIFHFEPTGKFQHRIQFLIHGLHHADPKDPTRLVMPPTPSLFLGITLYGFFKLFLGPAWVDPFFGFFLIGYLSYDYIHFSVHHFTPRTRLGKFLKQSHMIHHFVNPHSRWGVSSPFWDYVFGTLEETKSVENES